MAESVIKIHGVIRDGIKFQKGCAGDSWYIMFDEEFNSPCCEHCYKVERSRLKYEAGYAFVCPRMVVAYNEGGYNSTGVCLDCILAAAAQIEMERDKVRVCVGKGKLA